MSGITTSWISGVLLCAAGGAVAVATTFLATVRSENEGAVREPKAAPSSMAEQFDDPEAIAERFCRELTQVMLELADRVLGTRFSRTLG